MSLSYQNYIINKTQSELDQEFETKLIRTVYSLKWLYDSSHPDFNNTAKNRLSWARVAHNCQKPYSECTNRWNSLLQTYFSSTSNNWIHHEDLKKFEPHLHNNFRIPNQSNPTNKPSQAQKEELLAMLLANSNKLLSNSTTLVERQNIWSNITFRCNAVQPGVTMGALEWKKYWYDMKQNFGLQRFMLRSKLRAMGTKLDVSKYTDDDMKILKICGVSMDDTMAVIAKALGKNIELGFNSDLIIPKCLRCLKQRNELIIDGYCETCRNLPSCDLCHVVCESNIVKYKTTNWSKIAKSLLPLKLVSVDEISLCIDCSNQLKKRATSEWKSCRICESEQPNLEFLYGTNNTHLRKSFFSATSFTFSETDGLPGYICKICKIQIQQLNNFYTKFWRTQCKLKSIHSNHFIGNSSDPTIVKDGQVVYMGANEKTNNKQIMVANSDSNMQSEPIETVPPTTIAPSTSIPISSTTTSKAAAATTLPTTVQQNCLPTYKVTAAIPAPPLGNFKRISIQKSGTGDGPAITNVNQGGGARKRIIPTNPPLAIKEIFSLQPSTQKPTATSKPSIKVIPTAALQQAKLHGVFSNETVTVTRKTIDLPQAAQTPPVINPNKTINIVNLANGNSVALPSATNLLPSNRGFTLTKRVPTAVQSDTNPTLTTQKEFVKILPKPGPPNTISPKASASSKPAIFTISDYETVEDAPPVFCIPKKNLLDTNKTAEAEAEKQLTNFNPSNPPVIKTEVLDREEYPNAETAIQTNLVVDPEPSIENVPELPSLPSEAEPCTASGMKIIRLNGSMVAVKPHPYISGAFIPVDLNTQEDRLPSYIRKVDTGQKTQVATTNMVLKNNPHRPEGILPVLPRKQPPTVTNPKQNLPISQATMDFGPLQATSMAPAPPVIMPINEANILMTPEQVEQFVQAQQLHERQNQQQQVQLELRQQEHQELLQRLQMHQHHHLQQQQQQNHQQHQQQQQQQYHQQQQQHHQQHQLQQHQQNQQHQQLQQQQGIKKPRKYWGTVDEFNVAPLPTKPTLPPPPSFSQTLATIQQPNEIPQQPKQQTPLVPWIEERKTPAPTEDPLNVQSSSNVKIKQEVPDNDVDDVSIVKTLTSNDTTPGMFYPDSFELENLTFGADVSLMINNIMIQQNSIIGSNMHGNNFDKYINPAFPISYGKRKPENEVKDKEKDRKSKKEEDTKVEAPEAETEAEVETRKKYELESEDKKENKTDDKNKEKEKEKDLESTPTFMKMKNLVIKLKRDKEPIITSRPKRLCTLQVQPKSSPSSSPSVPIRKSLRLNHT